MTAGLKFKSRVPVLNLVLVVRSKGNVESNNEAAALAYSLSVSQEHELEAYAHDYLHQSHSSARSRSPSPVKSKWGATHKRVEKEKGQETPAKSDDKTGIKNEGYNGDQSKAAVETEAKKTSNTR